MSDIFIEQLTEKNNYIIKRAKELKTSGSLQKSINLFEISLQKSPNNHRLYFEFSLFLYQSSLYSEALQIAIFLKDQFSVESARLSHLIADSYFKVGDFDQATQYYESTLKLNIYCEGAAINLSAILGMQGKIQNAVEILTLFLNSSDSFDATLNLANLKYLSKDYIGAKGLYINCLKEQENHVIVQTNLCECARITCDWSLLDVLERQIATSTSFYLDNGQRVCEPPLHHLFRSSNFKENLLIAQSNMSNNNTKAVYSFNNKVNGEILRVGYLSDDFGEHPVAYLLLPILKLHIQSKTQVILLQYGATDSSKIRKNLYECSTKVIELTGTTEKIVKEIRNLELDILIDLKGLTMNHRQDWLYERLAPVQVSFLGYTGTTANPSIDYIITDEIVLTEQNKSFYTEKPLYMKTCFMPMDLEEFVDFKRFERNDFGLPINKVVLLVSVKPSRISKELFQAWLDILEENDRAVLWFINFNQASKQEMILELNNRGLTKERLIFQCKPQFDQDSYLERKDHLARLSLSDLVLDSWTYNGHSTTVDAIIARRQVITLKGADWSSSVSASILRSLGNGSLVCETKEDYQHCISKMINSILVDDKIGKNQIDLSNSRYRFDEWFKNYEDLLKSLVLHEKKKDS